MQKKYPDRKKKTMKALHEEIIERNNRREPLKAIALAVRRSYPTILYHLGGLEKRHGLGKRQGKRYCKCLLSEEQETSNA